MRTFIENVVAQPMLTTAQTAAFLGLHPGTLQSARSRKSLDIPFVKIGRAVRYHLQDVLEFIDANKKGGAI
jgi:hypothetical protein